MKLFVKLSLVSIISLALVGFTAVNYNIGKTKEGLSLVCNGSAVRHGLSEESRYDYKKMSTIFIKTEYYPWEDNKTYSINFKESNVEFHLTTKEKSNGNDSQPNYLDNYYQINNLNIYFRRGYRNTFDNGEDWTLNSKIIIFDFNPVTLETSVKIYTGYMSRNSERRSEYEFSGKCSAIKPTI